MHSVRMEACDCPPAQQSGSEELPNKSFLPENLDSGDLDHAADRYTSQFFRRQDNAETQASSQSEHQEAQQDGFLWGRKNNKKSKGYDAVKKVSKVKGKSRSSVLESEKHRRITNDGFLRVLFWQFHNFRMLLGSDLLLFSNEKYVAVSLHLWDISRQVTPLIWLEAWLDNVMASVPELAICYHQNGVVQGYELLKTDDIFLTKGLSEDGSPAFHPYVVQQNGHSVLRFLQENCKQDPGAYWLYKSAGEDVVQLFDLSVIPKDHSTNDSDDCSSSLPSAVSGVRSDSLLSLGTLLYRIAHRLSLSMSSPPNKARCASFFKKWLDFLDQPCHLVVRAIAHEQFARLLLKYDQELNLTSEVLPGECEAIVVDAEEEPYDCFNCISEVIAHEIFNSSVEENEQAGTFDEDPELAISVKKICFDKDVPRASSLKPSDVTELGNVTPPPDPIDCPKSSETQDMSLTSTPVIQTVADPISSKLAAIHHVSQAIKSLRWKRQLQNNCDDGDRSENMARFSMDFSVCACGDADCIEVCDIRKWLPTSKLDDKLWKLVLLLGESYLALGEAYKDDGQLHETLKVVELACLIYGSMPQHLEDVKFISSMVLSSSFGMDTNDRRDKPTSTVSHYLFWAKAWTLVGDVYVEFHITKSKEISIKSMNKPFSRELGMSSDVLKELGRLKKKLGKFSENCSSCSLVNCSCQSDRASSGSNASSSSGYSENSSGGATRPFNCGKLHGEKSYLKTLPQSPLRKPGICEEGIMNIQSRGSAIANKEISAAAEADMVETKVKKNGGIFKYLHGHGGKDVNYNLISARSCYEEARKALGGHPSSSAERHSLFKKKGWVCNELGRKWLEEKEMGKAESAFAEAIDSFRKVSDFSNVILINCNLGHGRRAVAEEMVLEIEKFRKHSMYRDAYIKILEAAKSEYGESLRYYAAAKKELNAFVVGGCPVSNILKNEVYTQLAHTYLRLGMLLAKENTSARIYVAKKEFGKHEISASDVIGEALSLYESLGELRKQEAAYAYFQLACFQRDCCLRLSESDVMKGNMSKGENSVIKRIKQYASLAQRNWEKSIEFYRAETHSVMYLNILIERSALSFSLSKSFHFDEVLEPALDILFEGRHVSEDQIPHSLKNDTSKVYEKFWSQLQMLLKGMLSAALPTNTSKHPVNSLQNLPPNKSGDVGKLKELYKLSLLATDFSQLHVMHRLWVS